MKLRGVAFILFFAVLARLNCAFAEESDKKILPEKVRLITVSQGIQMVLKDSRLIKISISDNEMAYQDSLVSRSALLPHLSALAVKTYNTYQTELKFGSQSVPSSDKDPFSFGLDVYQTLFDFGKSLSYYRASQESLKAAIAHTQSIRNIATLEFIVAYFDLLEAEKMITIAEKEVESISSYLADIEHLYEAGSAVKNDLLAAKVRLADARQRLITARNNREVVAARLNNILTLPLREKIMVRDIEMEPPKFPAIEDAWRTAESQRPEIAFFGDAIKASALTERAKAVENFPVIYADGAYDYNQNRYLVHEHNASLSLAAKMNLYDGGASGAQVRKERAKQKQLKEQQDKLIEDIKFEIEDSFYGLKDACEKVLVAKDALGQSEENVRFYRVKYNAGAATSTEVLEAITLETKAQTNYFSDDYEVKRGYAKLMYAMGIDLALVYEKMESEKNGRQQ